MVNIGIHSSHFIRVGEIDLQYPASLQFRLTILKVLQQRELFPASG